jgi:hypothetical protein
VSLRFEGTQINIDDAVQKAEYIEPEKKDDWQEVRNYVEAIAPPINNFFGGSDSDRELQRKLIYIIYYLQLQIY